MNRTSVMIPALLAAVLIVVTPVLIRAAAPSEEDARIGRYQLVAVGYGAVYVIDTTSGQCWRKADNGQWIDEGNPATGEARVQRREPLSLELPEKSVPLTVRQRRAKPIPGSRERVLLQLGDITEGQVLLSVRTDDGEVLRDEISVREGDVVAFQVEKKKFFIRVEELRNILVGSDFAVFEISSRPPAHAKHPGAVDERAAESDP